MVEFATRLVTALLLGAAFWITFAYLPPIIFSCLLLAILAVILLFEWPRFFSIKRPLFWLIIPLYPVFSFALLIYLNQHPLYRNLLLELFVLVASFDTGSYLFGKLFGKHKMVPAISPGKTWEGFAGGVLCATIALGALEWYKLGRVLPVSTIFGLSLIVCSISFCGDLFESWLKRRAGIKHSGNTLPGHGGFLDRFDGIMFVAIFFYLLRTTLAQLLI